MSGTLVTKIFSSLEKKRFALAAAAFLLVPIVVLLWPENLIPESLFYIKYGIVSPKSFFAMPGSALGMSAPYWQIPIMRMVVAVLCFDAARMVSGPIAGIAAAIISLFFDEAGEQAFFAIWIMLFLSLAMRRSGRENVANAFFSGLAIGGAFLVRSGVILMPAAYIVLELFRSPGSLKARAGRSMAILAGCAISLLGWNVAAFVMTGNIPIFELNRANCNLVSGALGSVLTIEGDFLSLAGITQDENIYLWAFRYITRHPLQYFSAVLNRVSFFFILHPWLLLAAAAAAFINFRKEGFRLVSVMAAAFLLAHIVLSVEIRYFYPLLIMLSVLAGTLLTFPVRSRVIQEYSSKATVILQLIISFWIIYANTILLRAVAKNTKAEDVINSPGIYTSESPELLKLASEIYFSQRNLEKGYAFLNLAAEKGHDMAKKILLAKRGFPTMIGPNDFHETQSAAIFYHLSRNETTKAKENLDELRLLFFKKKCMARGSDFGYDSRIKSGLDEMGMGKLYSAYFYRALLLWPDSEHPELLERLSRILPLRGELALYYVFLKEKPSRNVVFWHEKPDATRKNGLDVLVEMMSALKSGPVSAAEKVYADNYDIMANDPDGKSLTIKAALISGSPKLLRDAFAGNTPEKREAAALLDAGRTEEAWILALDLQAGKPGFDNLVLDIIDKQKKLGFLKMASKTAEKGLSYASLPVKTRMLLAITIQDMGKPEMAADFFSKMLLENHRDPALYYNSAVARFLSRDYAGAADNAKSALDLDPAFPHAEDLLKLAAKKLNSSRSN